MTGRDCPQEFIDMADLVTENEGSQTPLSKGSIGAKGIEY